MPQQQMIDINYAKWTTAAATCRELEEVILARLRNLRDKSRFSQMSNKPPINSAQTARANQVENRR